MTPALETAGSAAGPEAEGNAAGNGKDAAGDRAFDFRLAFDVTPLPSWVVDVQSLRILEVNQAAAAKFGYSREELLGMTVREVRPQEEVQRLLEALREEISGPLTNYGIWRYRSRDGTDWEAELAVSPITYRGRKARLVMAVDVTARQALERKLAASEGLFRALTEKASELLTVVNGAGTITYESPNLPRILGYAPRELVGRSVYDVVHPDDLDTTREALVRVRREPGATVKVECRARRKDGAWLWFDTLATNLLDDPAVGGIVLTSRDVTHQKRARDEVAANRVLLQGVLETSAGAVFTLDRQGCYTSFNKAHAAIMKSLYGVDIRVGGCLLDYQAQAEDREAAQQNIGRALRGETVVAEAYSGGNGTERRCFRVHHMPIKGEDGGIAGVAVFGMDITDRRQAEEALKRSERMLHALLNASTEGIMLIKTDGTVLACNSALARRLGQEPGMLLGKNVFAYLPPDIAASRRAHGEEVARSGRPHRFEDQRGGLILDNHIYPILDEDGKVSAVAVYTQDITERERALKSLEVVLSTEKRFSEQLAALHEVTSELQMAGSFDDLCRRAVELGLSRLGFERLGIWFRDGADFVRGSFGTDEQGRLRDERALRHPIRPNSTISLILAGRHRSTAFEDTDLFDAGRRKVGRGSRIAAAMWSGNKVIGCISVDNLLRHQPIAESQRQLLEIYASRVGILCERMRAEESLRESERHFHTLADASPVGIFRTDADGRNTYVNHRHCEITGMGHDASKGNGWMAAVHPDDREALESNWLKATRAGVESRAEFRLKRQDGSVSWVLGIALPERDLAGQLKGYVGTLTDITAQKKAEVTLRDFAARLEREVGDRTAELRDLSERLLREMNGRKQLEQHILEISEREQRRIGQDLHDSIGQSLAATKFVSSALEMKLTARKSRDRQHAARLTRLLDRASEDVRAVARGLHPVSAEPDGLMSALSGLIENVRQIYKIPCSFECPAPVLLAEPQVAAQLYRIAQEAVNNALRHARPRHIWIGLRSARGALHLSVRDDGCGIAAASTASPGLGLAIMNYRASVIGASLSIRDVPKGGTLVECSRAGKDGKEEEP